MQRATMLGLGALSLLVGSTACPQKAAREDAAPEASASAGPSASADDDDDEVRPVYPLSVPPEPIATRLCQALYDMPEQRRAVCCNAKPRTLVTPECVRMLSYAVRTKAILLTDEAVDRCAATLDKTYAGCDWPGPATPDLPTECKTITQGTVAKGMVCRSSLECVGNLHCHGLGPTQAGRCQSGDDPGKPCSQSVDPLADYVRQVPVEQAHPECSGVCKRRVCIATVPTGGACKERVECGANNTCKGGKCVAAVPAKAGQACPDLVCEPGAQCLLGRCLVRQPPGSECTQHWECVGGCIFDDGGQKGTCGRKCTFP